MSHSIALGDPPKGTTREAFQRKVLMMSAGVTGAQCAAALKLSAGAVSTIIAGENLHRRSAYKVMTWLARRLKMEPEDLWPDAMVQCGQCGGLKEAPVAGVLKTCPTCKGKGNVFPNAAPH